MVSNYDHRDTKQMYITTTGPPSTEKDGYTDIKDTDTMASTTKDNTQLLHKGINIEEDDHCIRVSTSASRSSLDDDITLGEQYSGIEYRFRLSGVGDYDRYEYVGGSWTIYLPHWYSRIGSDRPLSTISMIINGERGCIFKYTRNNYFGRDMYTCDDFSLFIPHEISRDSSDKPYEYLSIDFE